MKKHPVRALSFLLFTLLLLGTSCATNTVVVKSWKKPGITASAYHKLFIIAISSDREAKERAEYHVASALENKGLTVIKSADVFAPGIEHPDRQAVVDIIKTYQPDAVLTIALLASQTERRYVPGGFYGYYEGWSRRVYSPGYYTRDKVYYLQTSLFDAKTEEMIWSAESETYNPASFDRFITGYKKRIYKQMKKDGLIN